MSGIHDQFHQTREEMYWEQRISALQREALDRRRQAIEGFRFRLAELSILAATATAALVAIRWRETGPSRLLSGSAAVAFLLGCLAETLLVWRAAGEDEKLQVWCRWDTPGPLLFVAGLILGILGVALLI